jgi:hypothetical protein
MSMVPVEMLDAPTVATPPMHFPVIVSDPVELFLAPEDMAPVGPPRQSPVIISDPVELLFAPAAPIDPPPLPEVQFPVMVRVPVDVTFTACAPCTVPPVQFPTMLADAGDAAENCRQSRVIVVDL